MQARLAGEWYVAMMQVWLGKRGRRAAAEGRAGSAEDALGRAPLTASRDIYRIVVIACIAMAAGIGCSRSLWIAADRLYPVVPVVAGMPAPSFAPSALLLIALLAVLVLAMVPRLPPWFRALPVGAIVLFVILDQSRLQPWVFMYAIVLAVAAFASRDDERNASVLMTLRFVVAAQYVWSGLQKANVSFVDQVWPTFADPLFGVLHLPPAAGHAAGFAVPLLELGVGCCLLVPRARRVGVVVACLTHATILASLIAAGENVVVWPWNVAMPVLDVVLFWNATSAGWSIASIRRFPLSIAVAVLVGVLPALSFAGRWDAYASWALYSGNTAQAVVVIDPSGLDRLPDLVRRSTWQQSRPMFIDLNRWSYDELAVPIYPEPRVFRAIGRDVCTTYGAAAVTLVILGRPDWRTGQRDRTRLPCADPTW
jgi:uncharacterized membrane protein YphA (DoxX/SURF4 family)